MRTLEPKIVEMNPDPRTRNAAICRLQTMNESMLRVVGIEISIPWIADHCNINIDPQHTEGKSDVAAIEAARPLAFSGGYFPDLLRDVFVVIRPDLDALGAIAVLCGEDVDPGRVAAIAAADKFANGPWKPTEPFSCGFTTPELGPICSLFREIKYRAMPIQEKYRLVVEWMKSGYVPEYLNEDYRDFVESAIKFVGSVQVKDGVAYLEAGEEVSADILYAHSPLILRVNNNHDGNGMRKWSISQWGEEWCDFSELKTALQKLEPGVGGSPTFLGSTQGASSKLSLEELLDEVSFWKKPWKVLITQP
jgi:hypothetical protein